MPDKQYIFIVGSPRSGTTWVQNLLATHPLVSSGPESGLFTNYIRHLFYRWEHQSTNKSKAARGSVGLPDYLSLPRFYEITKQFTLDLLSEISSDTPYQVLKTPSHALTVTLIKDLVPSSKFINVVRDGRDVIASLLAASKSWGKDWAPKNSVVAANIWIQRISSAHQQLQSVLKNRKLLIKYEDLSQEPEVHTKKLFELANLKLNPDRIKKIVEQNTFEKMKQKQNSKNVDSNEPEGFYRKGEVQSWKEDLNIFQRFYLNRKLAPYLGIYNYPL